LQSFSWGVVGEGEDVNPVESNVGDSVVPDVKNVEDSVGKEVGDPVGRELGDPVGREVGDSVGREVGDSVGREVGDPVGREVGDSVGEDVGDPVGREVGDSVGSVPPSTFISSKYTFRKFLFALHLNRNLTLSVKSKLSLSKTTVSS